MSNLFSEHLEITLRNVMAKNVSYLLNPLTRPSEAVSHAQKVCRFYKMVIRDIQARTHNQTVPFRYHAVKARAMFDENKNLSYEDSKKALADAEISYVKNRYVNPLYHKTSPGGCAFDRHQPVPDWLVDAWHPLEKAQYPKYFALRDIRKREYIERYEKKYGTAS